MKQSSCSTSVCFCCTSCETSCAKNSLDGWPELQYSFVIAAKRGIMKKMNVHILAIIYSILVFFVSVPVYAEELNKDQERVSKVAAGFYFLASAAVSFGFTRIVHEALKQVAGKPIYELTKKNYIGTRGKYLVRVAIAGLTLIGCHYSLPWFIKSNYIESQKENFEKMRKKYRVSFVAGEVLGSAIALFTL